MSKIVLAEQSSAPDTPGAGKVAIYVDTDGSLCWRRDDGTIAKIAAAGTYSLTIPATGTAALLGTAQTFSAAQTFSNVLTAPGMKPAADSTTAIQLQNAAGTAVLTVDTTNARVLASQIGINTSILFNRPQEGVVQQQLETVNLAADGVITMSASGGRALVFVYATSQGYWALAAIEGGATLIYNGGTKFSTTADTANRINIYGSFANSEVYIQNKFATTQGLRIYLMK